MRSCLSGSGIFNQTSSPQLRPHGRSFATPTLQDFKEKKLHRYHRIRHVCPTSWNPKKQDHAEILSRHTKGILMNFGFSFPSRANVVKVTHLNVTGCEALISWASGTNVPWPFKEHNVTILDPPWSTFASLVCRSVRSPLSTTWTAMILSEATTEVMALDAQSAIRARSSWRTSRKRPSQIAARSSTVYRARMEQGYAMPLPSRCCRAAW